MPATDVDDAGMRAEARALGLGQADGSRSARRVAAHLGVYVAAGLIADLVGGPLARAAAWTLQAVILLGALAASHEAIHNNLFAHKARNRRAGSVLAAVAGISFSSYRAYHLAHHSDTRGPSDPEPKEQASGPAIWTLAMLLGGLVFLLQTWTAVGLSLLGRPPAWARHEVHRSALRRAGAWAALAAAGLAVMVVRYPSGVLHWWFGPVALLWAGLASFVVLPEHNGLEAAASALQSTRTTTSNRLFRWLFWNNNLHTAHHLVPTVPWHQLEELQAIIAPECQHVASGYFSYHLAVIRGRPR